MNNITLFMGDEEGSENIREIIHYIALDAERHELYIERAYQTANGLVDPHGETIALSYPFSINDLHQVLEDHDLPISSYALLENEDLLNYYIAQNDPTQLKNVERFFEDEIKQYDDEEDLGYKAMLYQNYGFFLEKIFKPEKALKIYQQEEDLLHEAYLSYPVEQNAYNERAALENVADVYYKLRKYQEALDTYQEMARYKKEKDDYEYGHICEKIALTYQAMYQYDQAARYHQQEVKVYTRIMEEERSDLTIYNTAISLRQLAKSLLNMDDRMKEAQDYLQQSLDLLEKIDDSAFDPMTMRDTKTIAIELLGDVAMDLGELEEGERYYHVIEQRINEDYQADPSASNLFSLVIIHKKLGRLYLWRKEYEKALSYFEKCLDEIEKNVRMRNSYNDYSEGGIALMNIGWVYYNMGDYDQAYDYFYEDLRLRKELYKKYKNEAADYALSLAYRNIADVEEKQRHYVNSLEDFGECLGIAGKYLKSDDEGRQHYYYVAEKDYARLLYKMGQYRLAYEHFIAVKKYLDHHEEKYNHEYSLTYEDIALMKKCEAKLNETD